MTKRPMLDEYSKKFKYPTQISPLKLSGYKKVISEMISSPLILKV
jgi:hypothetical protein